MITFKDFLINKILLTEGGNITFDNGKLFADSIDLTKIKREELQEYFKSFFNSLNNYSQKEQKDYIFDKKILNTIDFLSGSAKHFFDNSISDEHFLNIKNSLGDIDIQLDKQKELLIKVLLNKLRYKTISDLKLLNFKSTKSQFITLWKSEKYKTNIQIDFELVEYENNKPSSFSQFSHSSPLLDMEKKIKGVFHKFLIRACLKSNKQKIVEVLKTKEKVVDDYLYSFSVSNGLRAKYTLIENSDILPRYKKISANESTYITDISKIFYIIFNKKPTTDDLKNFESFVGLIKLIKKYCDEIQIKKIVNEFVDLVFGDSSRSLYRNDDKKDKEEKIIALNTLIDAFNLKIDKYKSIIKKYGN